MSSSRKWRTVGAAMAIVVIISGCSAGIRSDRHKVARADSIDEIRRTFEEATTQIEPAPAPEPPPEVTSALLPELALELPEAAGGAPVQQRFDLSVNGVDAQPFFSQLVEGTNYNMVVHPAVEGRITLEMKDVTVTEVMETVREVYGYEFQRASGGFIVLPARLRSQVFSVDYLNVARQGEATTRVTSGSTTDAETRGRGSGGGIGPVTQRGGNSRSRTLTSSEIKTKIQTDFWSALAEKLQTIIGDGPGRSVVVDPQAGLVVVRAMPGELRDVGDYLARAQSKLQRQVILEAKIVEVRLDDGHRTGIDWVALGRSGSTTLTGGNLSLVNGEPSLIGGPNDEIPTDEISQQDAFETLGNAFFFGISGSDFAALLRLLATQGDVQVLSSPRVSTVNNQKAVIKVGSDEFFVTDVSSTTVTGTATTTTPNITLTPFFSGIALDVTPQISDDSEVILHIHPSVSEVQDQIKRIEVGGQDQTLPLAFSTVREADSIVRARTGQVVVIGGLMQDQTLRQDARTPGLGDVPVVGGLFRQNERQVQRSELVILLRPIVVDNDRVWAEEIDHSYRRYNSITRDTSAEDAKR